LPIDKAAAYLPESMALVQSSIVPSNSKSLAYEEMTVIEETVRGIIEVLAKSEKPQDVKVSQELYGLYNTRPPYIWTRVRVVKPHTPKTLTPLSPSAIIDALENISISAERKGTSQQGRFVDLEYQQDIICTLTKVLPRAAQTGQPDRAKALSVEWAVNLRQKDITNQGARPSTPWMFFSLRQTRFGKPGPGQQQQYRPRQPQHQQHQQQSRPFEHDARKPQTTRHMRQPGSSMDSMGQPARRWIQPSAPAPTTIPQVSAAQVPTEAAPTETTAAHNANQRSPRRKPNAKQQQQEQQQQQGERLVDRNVFPAGKEILVSSAN
jgi:hypothetical protein